mmetsp:Transcript_2252/g.5245  ORF Transcript_2252/g.5245 Transcript_2252/m.5245 type:complete len:605 (+) Transcript_2252:94-1908(+)
MLHIGAGLVLLVVLAVAVPATYHAGKAWVQGLVERQGAGEEKAARSLKLLSAGRKRYVILSTLAWATWGPSVAFGAYLVHNQLSHGPEVLLVNLGATFVCVLIAEVFMISAFIAQVSGSKSGKISSVAVVMLGTFLAILGGVLVSIQAYLPDERSKLVYTILSGICILIGATSTHGLGGWVEHYVHRESNTGGANDAKEDTWDEWCFWQPFRGGSVFMLTQCCGWVLFGASFLGLVWMSKLGIAWCGGFCLSHIRISVALIMVFAQLFLAGSLKFFKHERTPRDSTWFFDWALLLLLYCPHGLVVTVVIGLYALLPAYAAGSVIFSIFAVLEACCWEWPAFKIWIGSRLERLAERLLGGVRLVHDDGDGEEDLGKDDRLIFAYHPHALFPLGVIFFHLLPSFQTRFPGIRPITLVASVLFKLPFLRSLAFWSGCRVVSGSVFRKSLSDRGAVAVIPGGQAELCEAPRAHSKDCPEIVLHTQHKGFVKIALETGARIVPVLCFGEIYQLTNGICMPKVQSWTYKALGFPIPFIPVGRFGFTPLPLRLQHPLTFVIGKSVPVERVQGKISQDQVEATHAMYYKHVEALYNKYKDTVGYSDKPLVLR